MGAAEPLLKDHDYVNVGQSVPFPSYGFRKAKIYRHALFVNPVLSRDRQD